MCGGRSLGRLSFGLGGCGGHYIEPYTVPYRGPYESGMNGEHDWLEAEIRRIYALGEIEQRQYYDAMDQLDRGLFTTEHLQQLRRWTEEKGRIVDLTKDHQKTVKSPNSKFDLEKEIASIGRKLTQVQQEKQNTTSVSTGINNSIAKLKEQMTLDEQMAKDVIRLDEDQARNYLRDRQELIGQVAGLEVRLKELSDDLLQLEQIETHLNMKQLELQALAQRERVVQLAGEIKDYET